MPNPVLNEKALRGAMDIDARESASGWAAPGAAWTAPGEVSRPPLHDGPISPFRPDRLTVGGVARSGLILFGVLVVGGQTLC